MFGDLRRGFAENFQKGVSKIFKVLTSSFLKMPKKGSDFAFTTFFTSKMTSKFKFDLIQPT